MDQLDSVNEDLVESRSIQVGVPTWYAQEAAEKRLLEDPSLGAQVILSLRRPEQGAMFARGIVSEELRKILITEISEHYAIKEMASDLANWIMDHEDDLHPLRGPRITIEMRVRSYGSA